MARMIRHEHTGPIKLDPQEKPFFICACGLSQKFPHCDGSHKQCCAEEPGTLYSYENENPQIIDDIPNKN
jgi:CDGSH-type Zn-finger protein